MRNLTAILLISAICVSGAFAQSPVVPFVYGETLIGGAQNGRWLAADKTDAQIKDKTEFKIVSLSGVTKSGIVGTKNNDRGVCENPRITFELGDDNDTDDSPFLIGANAAWNPVPRIPQAINLTDRAFTKFVADLLRTKGISKTTIKITQAFRVDLDNDGRNEILITGNYYRKGMSEEQSAGDYSFILLRRTVKGKLQNVLLEGEFYTSRLVRSRDFDPPSERRITAIADLNGDGKMEFMLSVFGYEYNSNTIFEMKSGRPISVLASECGV